MMELVIYCVRTLYAFISYTEENSHERLLLKSIRTIVRLWGILQLDTEKDAVLSP